MLLPATWPRSAEAFPIVALADEGGEAREVLVLGLVQNFRLQFRMSRLLDDSLLRVRIFRGVIFLKFLFDSGEKDHRFESLQV